MTRNVRLFHGTPYATENRREYNGHTAFDILFLEPMYKVTVFIQHLVYNNIDSPLILCPCCANIVFDASKCSLLVEESPGLMSCPPEKKKMTIYLEDKKSFIKDVTFAFMLFEGYDIQQQKKADKASLLKNIFADVYGEDLRVAGKGVENGFMDGVALINLGGDSDDDTEPDVDDDGDHGNANQVEETWETVSEHGDGDEDNDEDNDIRQAQIAIERILDSYAEPPPIFPFMFDLGGDSDEESESDQEEDEDDDEEPPMWFQIGIQRRQLAGFLGVIEENIINHLVEHINEDQNVDEGFEEEKED